MLQVSTQMLPSSTQLVKQMQSLLTDTSDQIIAGLHTNSIFSRNVIPIDSSAVKEQQVTGNTAAVVNQ